MTDLIWCPFLHQMFCFPSRLVLLLARIYLNFFRKDKYSLKDVQYFKEIAEVTWQNQEQKNQQGQGP